MRSFANMSLLTAFFKIFSGLPPAKVPKLNKIGSGELTIHGLHRKKFNSPSGPSIPGGERRRRTYRPNMAAAAE